MPHTACMKKFVPWLFAVVFLFGLGALLGSY
jgi:hypothetical protein